MRTILIIIFSILNSLNLLSQSHTAFDGSTFTVGDSIIVGLPSNTSSFEYIKSFDADIKGYKEVRKNIVYNKFPIKGIHQNTERFRKDFYNENATIIEFGKTGFLGISYYADIDNAIKKGEIVLSVNPSFSKNKVLNDTLAYIYHAKTSGNSIDSYKNEYLYRFKRELYQKTHQDEFEYQKSLSIAKKEMQETIDNFDFIQDFTVLTSLNVGNYNFDNSVFPLTEEQLILSIVELNPFLQYKSVNLYFPNYNEFSYIVIDSESANSFVKRRKDRFGDVNRKVYLKISFNLVEKSDDIGQELKDNIIIGKIKSIEFYDFDHCNYNWLGTTSLK
jgi:hypothetical protein